jgi:hypothetical protein
MRTVLFQASYIEMADFIRDLLRRHKKDINVLNNQMGVTEESPEVDATTLLIPKKLTRVGGSLFCCWSGIFCPPKLPSVTISTRTSSDIKADKTQLEQRDLHRMPPVLLRDSQETFRKFEKSWCESIKHNHYTQGDPWGAIPSLCFIQATNIIQWRPVSFNAPYFNEQGQPSGLTLQYLHDPVSTPTADKIMQANVAGWVICVVNGTTNERRSVDTNAKQTISMFVSDTLAKKAHRAPKSRQQELSKAICNDTVTNIVEKKLKIMNCFEDGSGKLSFMIASRIMDALFYTYSAWDKVADPYCRFFQAELYSTELTKVLDSLKSMGAGKIERVKEVIRLQPNYTNDRKSCCLEILKEMKSGPVAECSF